MAHDAPPSGGEPRETRLARATRAAVLAGLRQSTDGPGPLLRRRKSGQLFRRQSGDYGISV
jgi:hypothetical protein